jgi:hypothetical protein
MKKPHREIRFSHARLLRESLEAYIAQQPSYVRFKVHDWLDTLETAQLHRLEKEARDCCESDAIETLSTTAVVDLVDIATMAYVAERCGELCEDEAAERVEDLLIGLAVAACIERLRRAGWVVVTNRFGIMLTETQPYRITHKGLTEGFWSSEAMILWLLGTSLEKH